ncbi:hypothetical protein Vafri_831, partial [Volvox africanus]
ATSRRNRGPRGVSSAAASAASAPGLTAVVGPAAVSSTAAIEAPPALSTSPVSGNAAALSTPPEASTAATGFTAANAPTLEPSLSAAITADGAVDSAASTVPLGTAGATPLLPLSEMVGCEGNSLMSAVMKAPELVTLRTALNAAGLQPRLNNDRVNMTFFAPADGAFIQLAADRGVTLEALLAEPLELRHLLLYHLLPGPVPPELLVITPALSTYWAGENVYVTQPFQGVVVGESGTATRIAKAVRVCGSYLYIVSHVLLPGPSLEALPPFIEYTTPTLNLAPVTTSTMATTSPRSCNPNGTILDVLRSNPDLSYTLGVIDTSRLTSLFNNASMEMTLLA